MTILLQMSLAWARCCSFSKLSYLALLALVALRGSDWGTWIDFICQIYVKNQISLVCTQMGDLEKEKKACFYIK